MKKLPVSFYILFTFGLIVHLFQVAADLFEKKDTASIEAGERLYNKMCLSCHGENGLREGANIGTALNNQEFLSAVSDKDLYHYIKYGRNGTSMPSYTTLSDEQLNQLVVFMRDWQTEEMEFDVPETISGDVENGERIYALYCLSCHGVEGVGKEKMGTALASPEYLQYTTDQQIWIGTAYGRENTRMAASLKGLNGIRQLSKTEITDVVTYIRSLEKK